MKIPPIINCRQSEKSLKVLSWLLIFSLSAHFIIRKISLRDYIADDYFSMQNALVWNCDLSSGWFSPLPRCFTLLTAHLYEIPIIYFAAILLLLCAKLFVLTKCYEKLTPGKTASIIPLLVVASGAVILVTIGGGGRFFLGNTMALTSADIFTRTWAQLLLLVALLTFVQKRYFFTSVIFIPAVLMHAVNALNFGAVLFIAFLFSANRENLRRIPLYLLPIGIVVCYQYYLFVSGSPTSSGPSDGSLSFSTKDWYSYVYSQDADDVSILYYLKLNWLTVGYFWFGLFGLYLAFKVERPSSFRESLRRPGIAIPIAAYTYFLICGLVEYFQGPDLVFEKLITLQPRRVMFLPILILSYYISCYLIEFLTDPKKTTFRRLTTLFIFFVSFFSILAMSSGGETQYYIQLSYPMLWTLTAGAVFLLIISFVFLSNRRREGVTFPTLISWLMLPAMIGLVFVKTAPYISPKTFADVNLLFYDLKPRNYVGYLLTESKLRGTTHQTQDFLELARYLIESVPKESKILTIGIDQKLHYDLIVLTQTDLMDIGGKGWSDGQGGVRAITTSDVFTGFRGRTHYSKNSFQQLWPHVRQLTKLSLDGFIALGREQQMELMSNIALSSVASETDHLKNPMGELVDFAIYNNNRANCRQLLHPSFVVYQNDTYCLVSI